MMPSSQVFSLQVRRIAGALFVDQTPKMRLSPAHTAGVCPQHHRTRIASTGERLETIYPSLQQSMLIPEDVVQGDQEAHDGHRRAVAMQLLSYPVLLITAARQEVAYAPWVTHMVSCCPADFTWQPSLHKAWPLIILGMLFCMMQRLLTACPATSAAR